MDKFGIFELLDTLAQITSNAQEEAAPPPDVSSGRPSPDDKSFLPPTFSGETATDEQKLQQNALSALYERHESISKRIDKKK